MNIVDFAPGPALIGGILIGLATGLALMLNGKIAGVSGVIGRIFRAAPGDTEWRIAFVVGLVLGGATIFALSPTPASYRPMATMPQLAIAGFLVGIGTRLGGGCTSGHGVCGISRGSFRGLVGTLTFMIVAFATVYLTNHVMGIR